MPKQHPDEAHKGRERKRAADRAAQRDHRRRQKERVAALEAELEFVKQTSCPEQVSTLLAENATLREKLSNLTAFYSSIENLVNVHRPPCIDQDDITSTPGYPSPGDTPSDKNRNARKSNTRQVIGAQSAPVTTIAIVEIGLIETDTASNSAAYTSRTLDANNAVEPAADICLEDRPETTFHTRQDTHSGCTPTVPEGDSNVSLLDCDRLLQPDEIQSTHRSNTAPDNEWWIPPSEQTWDPCDNEARFPRRYHPSDTTQQNSWFFPNPVVVENESSAAQADLSLPPEMAFWIPTASSESDRASMPMYHSTAEMSAWANLMSLGTHHWAAEKLQNPCQWPSMATVDPSSQLRTRNISYNEIFGFPFNMSVSLPILRNPPVMADCQLHKFVMDARRFQGSGFPSGIVRPSVLDFMDNSTTNMLAVYVKSYLAQRRGFLRVHEALATFWTMAHHAKWLICRDEQSWKDLPVWLRPTNAQTSMEHPLMISFLPWPHMRDELVKISLSNPDAAYEILVHLGMHLRVDLSCRTGHSTKQSTNTDTQTTRNKSTDTDMTNDTGTEEDSIPVIVGSEQHTQKFHELVAELRNWYIQEPFFQRYPFCKPLYEKSIAIYAGPAK